jgi:hypothetical protein
VIAVRVTLAQAEAYAAEKQLHPLWRAAFLIFDVQAL